MPSCLEKVSHLNKEKITKNNVFTTERDDKFCWRDNKVNRKLFYK